MSESVGRQFPSGNLLRGHEHFDLTTSCKYRYLGGDPKDLLNNWLLVEGELSGHPDTSQWGERQAGARWYNKALRAFFGWDGTQIVQLSE